MAFATVCVKKATGKSAQKIIIDYKMLYVKTLLHQMNKSVAEVAYALNFNEVANFNQFFERNIIIIDKYANPVSIIMSK